MCARSPMLLPLPLTASDPAPSGPSQKYVSGVQRFPGISWVQAPERGEVTGRSGRTAAGAGNAWNHKLFRIVSIQPVTVTTIVTVIRIRNVRVCRPDCVVRAPRARRGDETESRRAETRSHSHRLRATDNGCCLSRDAFKPGIGFLLTRCTRNASNAVQGYGRPLTSGVLKLPHKL